MIYFEIEPDVAGGIGRGTVMDTSVHPPVVSKLVYHVEGWFGDSIVTTFPCYLVTEEAKRKLVDIGASGAAFAEAEITISENFHELQPGVELPSFVWLKVDGRAGRDDFGIAGNLNLVVSERALDVLDELGLPSASIRPFPAEV